MRRALGLRALSARLCCQPPRYRLSREVGLALSAQHAVVLVHAHTTAAGRDFIRLGHDRHTACVTLVTRPRGREVAADIPDLRIELIVEDEPVYCAECWQREFGESAG